MKTKEKPIFEKYTFQLGTKEEAEAWVVYVKERVKNLDKKHNPQTPTFIKEEITADGLVTLNIKTEFYRSDYIMSMIYPVVITPKSPDVENIHIEARLENLFISVMDLDIPYRLRNVLRSIECENLGDAICITQGRFFCERNAGKKSWAALCEMIESYGFEPAHPFEKWEFGKQEENRKLLD